MSYRAMGVTQTEIRGPSLFPGWAQWQSDSFLTDIAPYAEEMYLEDVRKILQDALVVHEMDPNFQAGSFG